MGIWGSLLHTQCCIFLVIPPSSASPACNLWRRHCLSPCNSLCKVLHCVAEEVGPREGQRREIWRDAQAIRESTLVRWGKGSSLGRMLRKEEKGPTHGRAVCGCGGGDWRGFPRKSRERVQRQKRAHQWGEDVAGRRRGLWLGKREPGDQWLQISRWGILAYLLECCILRVGRNFRGYQGQTIPKSKIKAYLGRLNAPLSWVPLSSGSEEQVTSTRWCSPVSTVHTAELITISTDVHLLPYLERMLYFRSHHRPVQWRPREWNIITKPGTLICIFLMFRYCKSYRLALFCKIWWRLKQNQRERMSPSVMTIIKLFPHNELFA